MIPLIGQSKELKMGFMRRMPKKDYGYFIPGISPGIQGLKAFKLLDERQKQMLLFALKDASERHKCSISELKWAFEKAPRGRAALHITPPQKPITIK